MTEPPKNENEIPNKDIETLKNHIRIVNGLELPRRERLRKPRNLKESKPKSNFTHRIRSECIKKRKRNTLKIELAEKDEKRKIQATNLVRRKSLQFNLNRAFHMRWKVVRKLPVIPAYYRKVFEDTGKLPFVVPTFYKPFNVYWDADWSKHEFIFLDDAGEERKRSETQRITEAPATPPSSYQRDAISTTTAVSTTVEPTQETKQSLD